MPTVAVERPSFSALGRQHSRSSSQIATLASSLVLSPVSAPTRLPGSSSPRWGVGSPSSSASGSRNPSPQRRTKSSGFTFGPANGEDEDEDEEDESVGGDDESQRGRPAPRHPDSPHTFSPSLSSVPQTTPPLPEDIGTEHASPLAQLIQQKRRQASAPYFASARTASLFSPGAGFGIVGSDPVAVEDGRKTGESSRNGSVGGLQLAVTGLGGFSHDMGMVVTPTTEEWRNLGGQLSELADIRARDEARLALVESPAIGSSQALSTSSSSSSISLTHPHALPPHHSNLAPSSELDPPSPPLELRTTRTSFSYQTSRSGFSSSSHGHSLSYSSAPPRNPSLDVPPSPTTPHSDPLPSVAAFKPSHRPQNSADGSNRPNLSRGSLSSTPNKTTAFFEGIVVLGPEAMTPGEVVLQEDEVQVGTGQEEDGDPLGPVRLDWVASLGPVDPRKYSAVTGFRGIEDFVIEGEAGKGAYGTVRKAREKGPDGQAVGPMLIIKYVIKQRILADCWKKHKILGPIPIEIHVLDHLRRVPYVPRPSGRRRKLGVMQRRNSAPSIKEGTITGHPNVCGMLDFFEDGEFYYLVMPQAGADPERPLLSGGQDLFEFVELHPDGLAPPSIRHILSQIADALYFLHEHGIVHRDIKDENIVLDHAGNVQVIDFGSAAYVKDGKKFDTFSGTLDFAAPEVLKGQRYGGKETDIWALGVLGYVLICGECPFWNQSSALDGVVPESRAYIALHAKILTSTSTTAPERLPANFHRPLDGVLDEASMADAVDLIMRCLEVEPGNRPSANDVLDHRFLLGNEGWSGLRGFTAWARAADGD